MKWVRKKGDGINHDHLTTVLSDGEGWYEAYVKWDGCVDFTIYYNEPWGDENDDNEDGFHICDIDDFIERLQALKAAAKEHFGKEWPNQ